MAKSTLLIVESPAKAGTIQKYLGKNYKVLASMGHVIDLPKSSLGVDVENNFEPKYITIRGKGDLLSSLKKEAKKADEVLLATDPDREGEAISWHLARALDIDPQSKCRVTFNEITKTAVKEAIKAPRTCPPVADESGGWRLRGSPPAADGGCARLAEPPASLSRRRASGWCQCRWHWP